MTSAVASIIIPYASYHQHLVTRAQESAIWQTVDCDVYTLESEPTPAIARNMPVETPFVVWLDADDVLMPTFVEECLRAYEPGKYVLTAWYEGDDEKRPAPCPFLNGSYHIVTTLYPTAIAKALGGFDETLPGNEDIDFYLRSAQARVCGVYLNKPLISRPDNSGQRSRKYLALAEHDFIKDDVIRRNGGLGTIMGCCGMPGAPANVNMEEGLPGDVLAQTLWAGMRSENGHASGRKYVGGNGNILKVDPADVARMPHLFRVVEDKRKLAPDKEVVLKMAGLT